MDIVSKILSTVLVFQFILFWVLSVFQSQFPTITNWADNAQGINIIIGFLAAASLMINIIWS